MIWFIVGIAAGFGIGALCMALAAAASQADDSLDRLYERCGDGKETKPNKE